MSIKVSFQTLGCDKNAVDTEILAHVLREAGYTVVPPEEEADVRVVNTCAFIREAKETSLASLFQAAQEKERGRLRAVVAAGCLVQRYGEILRDELPEVDGFLGTGDLEHISEAVRRALGGERPFFVSVPENASYEHLRRLRPPGPVAYVKVAEGCRRRCSFCAIPLVRGGLRSRSIRSVVAEVEALLEEGVREVVLVAQDLSAYGLDLAGRSLLPDLIRTLDPLLRGRWLRLLYLYPSGITAELLEAMARSSSVVPYFDLSLQHVVPELLRRMGRDPRAWDAEGIVRRIREIFPDAALRSSFIVGFPGETEEDFAALLEFVRRAEIEHVGAFPYSPEEGTRAFALREGRVPLRERRRRAELLMEVGRKVAERRNGRRLGRVVPVLVERILPNGEAVGRTPYDAPEIDGRTTVRGYAGPAGEFVAVRLEHAWETETFGTFVPADPFSSFAAHATPRGRTGARGFAADVPAAEKPAAGGEERGTRR
ncbi:MAG: 30S ribosomal protein S12 methylthiotransferase RimO [Brockia lithotrophica]|nr:30S ribosomal protein S12 methylthiotransferase RimO [Brockia lithotrophica]